MTTFRHGLLCHRVSRDCASRLRTHKVQGWLGGCPPPDPLAIAVVGIPGVKEPPTKAALNSRREIEARSKVLWTVPWSHARKGEPMVGKLRISEQTEAVRQLFMEFEKNAKRIGTCCFCGSSWPAMKLAHQGHLTGNHQVNCPFEQLAAAGAKCIVLRSEGNQTEKNSAEGVLTERIEALFAAMSESTVPVCMFPICKYPHALGHRLQCPFNRLRSARTAS